MVIFHKIYILKPKYKNELEIKTLAIACLFISLKVCNHLLPLNDLVKEFTNTNLYKNKIIENSSLLEISERICYLELEILNKIGFDLNIDLPYKYMDSMVNYILKTLRNPKFLIIATSFLNDSFKLPLCLYYDPKVLALAGIYMTISLFRINLPDYDGKKWYQIIDNNFKFDTIIEVSNYIGKIYEYSSIRPSKTLVKVDDDVLENVYNHNIGIEKIYMN